MDARDEKIAYSRQLYDRYTLAIYSETSPAIRDMELIFATLPAVFYLLRKLPDKTYRLALLELHERLQTIAATSGAPPEVFEVLKALAPVVKARQNPDLPQRMEDAFQLGYGPLSQDHVRVHIHATENGQPDLPFRIVK